MLRQTMCALALAVSACAPGPVPMSATDASEVLTRFAGGFAPVDICSADGRALLRGAVRAYGAAMRQGGEVWPRSPDVAGDLNSVEVSVLIAVAAGFVEASDLRGPARMLAAQMSLEHWPAVRDLRAASQVACPELLQLQRTTARFVMERERYDALASRADDARAAERLRRQQERMARSMQAMRALAAQITLKVEESRASASRTRA